MLMKKISLLLVGLLAMFSCEQEDLEGIVKSDTEQVQTRATMSSTADFNQITELDGIPVNILNVGNTSRRYLSCAPSGSEMSLYTEDDGSLRQRWYVRSGNIILVGGNSSISSPPFTPTVKPNDSKTEPILAGAIGSFIPANFSFIPSGNNYYIKYATFSLSSPELYLQSDTQNGTVLKFKTPHSTDLALWRMVPVGEFRLIDVEYVKSEFDGDFINRRDQFIMGAIFPGEPFDVEHTLTVSETVRESSTFNETNGVSTQNQSAFHWSSQSGQAPLPVVSISGDLSTSITSSHSTNYTSTGGYDVAVSQTFKVVIPANTTCRVEVLKMSYNTTLTYVATLEKADGAEAGEKFRIKGKWVGIVTTFLYYNIYRDEDNKLLDTRVLDSEI